MDCVWIVCDFFLAAISSSPSTKNPKCYICNKFFHFSQRKSKNQQGQWYHHRCLALEKEQLGEYNHNHHKSLLVSFIPSSPSSLLTQNPNKKVNFQQELTKLVQMPDENIREQKDYNELGSSQRNLRRNLGKEVLHKLKLPLSAMKSSSVSTNDSLKITTRSRKRMRNINNINLPTERTIKKQRLSNAQEKGLESSSLTMTNFNNYQGAFFTDPIKLINSTCNSSSSLTIGGDKGGDMCHKQDVLKIGVTYINKNNKNDFLPLIFINGIKDDFQSLKKINKENGIIFKGESENYNSLWELFDSLNNYEKFLNGDLVFESNVLGLGGTSSHHFCPICTISKYQLKTIYNKKSNNNNDHSNTFHYRESDKDWLLSKIFVPYITVAPLKLINIPATHIVPAPLHVLLGLAGYMLESMEKITGQDIFEPIMNSIKQVHEKPAGLSDLFKLNGNEINKWIKRKKGEELISNYQKKFTNPVNIHRLHTMNEWIKQLQHYLLTNEKFTPIMKRSFDQFVKEIQSQWTDIVGRAPVPKLHILTHCVEFAQRHNHLGRYSESRLESSHYTVNNLRQNHFANLSSNEKEKLRKCLVFIGEFQLV